VVWFLSFGDLLTLLLCFFLVLTPWDKLSSSRVADEKQPVSSAPQTRLDVGTSLAAVPARERSPEVLAEVPLVAELATSQDGVAQAQLLGALEQAMEALGETDIEQVTVSVCRFEESRGEVVARVLPLLRGHQLSQAALKVEIEGECWDEQQRAVKGTGRRVGSVRISRV
jgi:hypothetical protein